MSFYLVTSFVLYFSVCSFFPPNLFCLRFPLPRLQGCIAFSFWFLPSVGKVCSVVCVDFLLRVPCTCGLVGWGEVFLFFLFFFFLRWVGLCEVVYFAVSVESCLLIIVFVFWSYLLFWWGALHWMLLAAGWYQALCTGVGQHPLNLRKSKRIPEKHSLLLHWLC